MFLWVRKKERMQAHRLHSLINKEGNLPVLHDNTFLTVVVVLKFKEICQCTREAQLLAVFFEQE